MPAQTAPRKGRCPCFPALMRRNRKESSIEARGREKDSLDKPGKRVKHAASAGTARLGDTPDDSSPSAQPAAAPPAPPSQIPESDSALIDNPSALSNDNHDSASSEHSNSSSTDSSARLRFQEALKNLQAEAFNRQKTVLEKTLKGTIADLHLDTLFNTPPFKPVNEATTQLGSIAADLGLLGIKN